MVLVEGRPKQIPLRRVQAELSDALGIQDDALVNVVLVKGKDKVRVLIDG